MTVTVFLAGALLCVGGQCYPALVGPDTPLGTFRLQHRRVRTPGYGGDVMVFAETPAFAMAIHRVWLGRPKERRLRRLTAGNPADRRFITHGCINVLPNVYDRIVTADTLEVRP